ncbi:MAG: hypothetical protein ABSB78_13890 [Bacteroidota bacterium]
MDNWRWDILLKFLLVLTAIPPFGFNSAYENTGKNFNDKRSPVDYIRPFVGTDGEGNIYPAAVVQFGMIRIVPTTTGYFIQSVRLNNKLREDAYLSYDEVKNWGTIVFTIGPKPNM